MTNMDPRIGVLCKEGKTVYYAYLNGPGRNEEPFEGALEQVEAALGLRPPPPPKSPTKATKGYRDYDVTVTPKVVGYAGSTVFGEYVVTVAARTAAEAISKVRADRRDEEGRFAVTAKFRARLSK